MHTYIIKERTKHHVSSGAGLRRHRFRFTKNVEYERRPLKNTQFPGRCTHLV